MKLRSNLRTMFLLLAVFGAFHAPCFASYHGLDGYQLNPPIDAVKNARIHSGLGNLFFEEGNYTAALDEYKIAFELARNTSSYAPYLYNIANCMMKLGSYNDALPLLNEAIKKDCMNLTYYIALVDCYDALGQNQKQLRCTIVDRQNPYSRIIAGLIYIKTGQITNAKVILDEFINDNPDMLITQDVKEILKNL